MQRQDRIALGFMTFALFLGAGNVVYPPMLGLQAGYELAFAAAGFLLTAVGLPLITLVSIAHVGGSHKITSMLPKKWGTAFWITLFIVMGPAFSIPRTAVVAYELSITPFVTETQGWHLVLFSASFIAIALLLAFKPSTLLSSIGKLLTPALIFLLAAIGIGALINPQDVIHAPIDVYAATPLSKGLVQGYMTMDCLGALAIGAMVGHSIKQMGITKPSEVTKCTIQASLIAGVCLTLVYVMLMYLGATSSNIAENADNGGKILTLYVSALFGLPGKIALAGVITLACLTTAVGAGTACADYFSYLSNGKISYKATLITVMGLSAIIANIGLTQLISISIPVIVALYPLAITLVIMVLLRHRMSAPARIYRFTLPVIALFALVDGINATGLLPLVIANKLNQWVPLFQQGLGWLAPFIITFGLAWMTSSSGKKNTASAI